MTFPEQYRAEIKRVESIRDQACATGDAGMLLAYVCGEMLGRARDALARYDTADMAAIYKEMKEIEG